MESQSAMFEVVSRSGSTSSDSIVNISRSGASSIVTSPSTTTTTTVEDKLRTEIDQLHEDKKILESRVRGFRTLSDLLVDFHKENDQLRSQLKAMNADPLIMSSTDLKASPSSPFSLVSMQAAQQNQDRSTLSQVDVGQLTLQDQKPSSCNPRERSSHSLDPKGPPVSYPPVSGPPFSLQETVGPPGGIEETKLISFFSSSQSETKLAPAAESQENIPKKESLEPAGTPQATKTHHLNSMASENSSPEILQLDSDKYAESTYEKVGLQLGMGHAVLTSSMCAAGGDSQEPRPTDFPSLSSGASSSFVQPSSHNSTTNPPFMAMMHQSLIGSTVTNPNLDLATEVENITERLNSEPGDSMPAIALQMHQIAERIGKVEQKKRDQKTLIETLMRENQELKRLVKATETTHQNEIVALREQNTQLMLRLKDQHREGQTKSKALKSSGSHSDWVHVDRPPKMSESRGDSDDSLVDRVRILEQEKAELLRANSNWKSQWDQIEHSHQLKVGQLRSELVHNEQELTTLKTRLAEQTSEFEGRMLEMKRRTGEEETQKEEAQHQQRLAERKCSELQDQITEMRTQMSDLARDKQILSTELSIQKAQITSQEMQTSGAANAGSRSALEAEISMLKEQLKVFAEDFEQERLDRTTAQAARDSAKKNVETMARQNHSLSSQIKHLQKQIKDRDDTISWTLRQNETLQRQATDFKKKLANEWEEKQTLQRRILNLEQQQLQHQPMRNPYLTRETTSTYNPAPMHQPPPARTTTHFYGGQGSPGGPARNLPVNFTMSPEHLPGAWTCAACTYINYPGRTVCESCGLVNTPRSHPDQFGFASHDMYGSEHALLMSRGGDQNPGGGIMPTTGDLVVDSALCSTT